MQTKTYYYLESIYLGNKNIIYEGKEELHKKPKNSNTKMEDGEIYIDWYDSNGSMISDRKMINGFNKFYLPCDYAKAKEVYRNGFELVISNKPTDDGCNTKPFFYIVKKGNYRSGFDEILNYFKNIHQNEDFNFFAHRNSKKILGYEDSIKVIKKPEVKTMKKITTTITNSTYRNFCLAIKIKKDKKEEIVYFENEQDGNFKWNYNFVDSKKYTIVEIENEIARFQKNKEIKKYLKKLSFDGKIYICRIARHTRTEIEI